MAKFATDEWAELYAKALNENENYRAAAGPKGFPPDGWEGDYIFVIEPAGNLDHQINMWIGLHHGNCTGAKILKETEPFQLIKAGEKAPEGVIGVEFIYSAKYDTWELILKKELDAIKALLKGKAKLKGDMAKVLKSTKAAKEMVVTTTIIKTELW